MATRTKPQRTFNDVVLREFPPIGQYRIRLLQVDGGAVKLDVREWRSYGTFEGFTPKGIRMDSRGMALLLDVLREIRQAQEDQEQPLDVLADEQAEADFEAEIARDMGEEAPKPAKPATAPDIIATVKDVRPLMDEILDATQKHIAGVVPAMPPAVQAKRETQKRLPLAAQAPAPVAPKGGKLTLSQLAALL